MKQGIFSWVQNDFNIGTQIVSPSAEITRAPPTTHAMAVLVFYSHMIFLIIDLPTRFVKPQQVISDVPSTSSYA